MNPGVSLLPFLRTDPLLHGWAIQDLMLWPEATKLHWVGEPGSPGFAYLLHTGHPSTQGRNPVLLLRGEPGPAEALLRSHAPRVPYLIRETPSSLLSAILKIAPEASHWLEHKMVVSRESFRPVAGTGNTRPITPEDSLAFAKFNGAPPQAAAGFLNWIRGAVIYGVFEGEELVSMASTMLKLPEVWAIIAVRTLESHQGRGLATQVVSAITTHALRQAPHTMLTVVQDNQPALKVYSKLGYTPQEELVWVDNGTGSKP